MAKSSGEVLVFDWDNMSVKGNQKTHIPRNSPPPNNHDFTSPVDYRGGTLHFRYEITYQPKPQQIYPQFCFWQVGPPPENVAFGIENCISYANLEVVEGTPGNVVTRTFPLDSLNKNKGKLGLNLPIDWSRPRQQVGCGIKAKTSTGGGYTLVSEMKNYNWAGQNPDEWYPLDWRITAVLVAPGSTFSGWENYVSGSEMRLPDNPGQKHGIQDGLGVRRQGRFLTVSSKGRKRVDLQILDLSGRRLGRPIGKCGENFVIPTGDVGTGVYLIRLAGKLGVHTERVFIP